MRNLIVRGALYYDRASDTILIPHFTGEFYMVDCTEYIPMEDLKNRFDEEFISETSEDYIEHEDKKYYYAESSPFNIVDWELISDLSELEHFRE